MASHTTLIWKARQAVEAKAFSKKAHPTTARERLLAERANKYLGLA